jgi:hypothetical protein
MLVRFSRDRVHAARTVRLDLEPASRVLVDLRATGLLRGLGHSPTLSAPCPSLSIDAGQGACVDVPVDVRFAAATIQPPSDLSSSDRDRMLENLRGRDVLDAKRSPDIHFRGRYTGTFERGVLAGELTVREAPRRISMDIAIAREGDGLRARGAWEGALTDLGIKPFRALLGALKLDDWIRLRLDTSWHVK